MRGRLDMYAQKVMCQKHTTTKSLAHAVDLSALMHRHWDNRLQRRISYNIMRRTCWVLYDELLMENQSFMFGEYQIEYGRNSGLNGLNVTMIECLMSQCLRLYSPGAVLLWWTLWMDAVLQSGNNSIRSFVANLSSLFEANRPGLYQEGVDKYNLQIFPEHAI